MESLGFIESPTTVSNSWTSPDESVPITATRAPSRTRRGAHERTVADEEPNDTAQLLVGSNVRWGLLAITVLLIGAFTAGAMWLLQRPAVEADSAATAVESAAQGLRPELTSLSNIVGILADQDLDTASIAAQTRAVDARARELFNAAGTLPATNSELRGVAADVATTALDASRLIGDAAAYRATVIQVLAPPALETDPQLIGLDDAVRSFGTWQQKFNQVRSALPRRTMSAVTGELTVIAGDLDSIQSRYIDALRDDDQAGAEAALAELAGRLAKIDKLLFASIQQVQERAGELIESSLAGMALLANG